MPCWYRRHSLDISPARPAPLRFLLCPRIRCPSQSRPSRPLCGAPAHCSELSRRSEVPVPLPYAIPSRAPSSGRSDVWTAADTSRPPVHGLRRSHARGRQRARLWVPPCPRRHHHSPVPWPRRTSPSIWRLSGCAAASRALLSVVLVHACACADHTIPTAASHPALAVVSLTARVHSLHPPQIGCRHTHRSASRATASRSGMVARADGRQ